MPTQFSFLVCLLLFSRLSTHPSLLSDNWGRSQRPLAVLATMPFSGRLLLHWHCTEKRELPTNVCYLLKRPRQLVILQAPNFAKSGLVPHRPCPAKSQKAVYTCTETKTVPWIVLGIVLLCSITIWHTNPLISTVSSLVLLHYILNKCGASLLCLMRCVLVLCPSCGKQEAHEEMIAAISFKSMC